MNFEAEMKISSKQKQRGNFTIIAKFSLYSEISLRSEIMYRPTNRQNSAQCFHFYFILFYIIFKKNVCFFYLFLFLFQKLLKKINLFLILYLKKVCL